MAEYLLPCSIRNNVKQNFKSRLSKNYKNVRYLIIQPSPLNIVHIIIIILFQLHLLTVLYYHFDSISYTERR